MGRSVSRKHSLKRDESNRSSKTASADLPVSTVIRQTHSDCQPASGEEEKKLATIKSFGSQDVVKVMQQPPNPIRSSDEAPNNTAYLSKKRSANILVVDDSGVNRAILSKLLKNNEYVSDIVELSTGHDAVRFCSKRIFTLIFMDLEMPGMNGEEAAARIRAMGVQTPIIATGL
ncbi:CheY-like superfamily [Chytriomyces sp. MP71]|nr:CheY-like superfamily [Chytriomyces sp. MP71]